MNMVHPLRSFLRSIAVAIPLTLSSAIGATAQDASSAVAEWSPYMAPDALHTFVGAGMDVQVIDIRREKDVKAGTIPGATWIPFPQWRAPKDRPGQTLTEVELEALLGANGIDVTRPIVVHNHNSKTIQLGRSAIVYWVLKSAGATELAILDGGFTGWSDAGLPDAAGHVEAIPAPVNVTYRDEWWADAMDIFALTTGQTEGAILDARLDAQVRKSIESGAPMMSMPMARYMPASLFTNPMSSRNLTREGQATFVAELQDRGIDPGNGFLISVCQTGELSALSWFYASEVLGLEDVRYYPDALRGWKSDGGLMFGMASSE